MLTKTSVLSFVVLLVALLVLSFTIYVIPNGRTYHPSTPDDPSFEDSYKNYEYEVAMLHYNYLRSENYAPIWLFDSILVECTRKVISQAKLCYSLGIRSIDQLRLTQAGYDALSPNDKTEYNTWYQSILDGFRIERPLVDKISRLRLFVDPVASSGLSERLRRLESYFKEASSLNYTYLEAAMDITGKIDIPLLSTMNEDEVAYNGNVLGQIGSFLRLNDKQLHLANNNPGLGVNSSLLKLSELIPIPGTSRVATTPSAETLPSNEKEFTFYPNPVRNAVTVSLYNPTDRKLLIKLVNVTTGQKIKEYNQSVSKGHSNFKLNLQEIPGGTYIVEIYSNSAKVKSFKLQKL
jgi:hypothetical protein